MKHNSNTIHIQYKYITVTITNNTNTNNINATCIHKNNKHRKYYEIGGNTRGVTID